MVARRAFTLIEVLVVITIIVVLAGLTLAAINPIRETLRGRQASVIIGTIQTALELAAAQRGASVSPAEHPLAFSVPTRSLFVRAGGGAVATSGTALRCVDPSLVSSGVSSRLLRDDDRFSGLAAAGDVPHLYGLRRDRLKVLGCDWYGFTKWRNLPKPPSGTASVTDDTTAYPDDFFAYAPSQPGFKPDSTSERFTREQVAEQALASALGAGCMEELAKMKALRFGSVATGKSDDDSDPNLCANKRLLVDGEITPDWQVASLQVTGGWQPYRFRGPSIVDPWGSEILFARAASGGILLISAGRDRHFRWKPGTDGVFQTQPGDSQPSGDDKDATLDNISVGNIGLEP